MANKKDYKEFPSKQVTTIELPCKWAKLNEPDTMFNPDGEYSIQLVVNEDNRGMFEKITEELLEETKKEVKPQLRKRPAQATGIHIEYDEEGEETGYILLKPKMKAKTAKGKELSVPVFDAKGKPLTPIPEIWNGSTVKANITFKGYEAGSNWGVTAKLNAVQIITLSAGAGGNATSFGFGEEEGFEAPSVDNPTPNETANEVVPDEDDF